LLEQRLGDSDLVAHIFSEESFVRRDQQRVRVSRRLPDLVSEYKARFIGL
jgi:hypothetical protein